MTKNKKNWLYILIIIILGFLIYSNSFKVPFQFDDLGNIRDNSLVHNLNNFTKPKYFLKTRSVGYFTFALNYYFSQENTFTYHLINLIIHITNSILVFLIAKYIFYLKKVKNSQTLGFLTSLIFLVHPLQTQAVTYIVQRFTSLSVFFYLLSFYTFIKFNKSKSFKHKIIFYSCLTILIILAVFTKESAITFPVILFIYNFIFNSKNKLKFKNILLYIIPVIILFLVFNKIYGNGKYIFAPKTNYQNEIVTSQKYFLTQAKVIPKYFQLLIFPINQSIDHLIKFDSQINFYNLSIFIILFLIIIYAFINYKKNSILSFSILWFFITISVEASIIPVADPMYEHRLYLPIFGFSLFIVNLIYQICKNNIKITRNIIVLISIIFSILTFQRNKIWASEQSLWQNVVFQYSENKRALNNLSSIYLYQKKYDKSLEYIKRILKIDPNYSYAYYNLGRNYLEKGNKTLAYDNFQKAYKLKLRDFNFYIDFANLSLEKEKYKEARLIYLEALNYQKNLDFIYTNLGIIYIQQNNLKFAKISFQQAIEFNPNYYQAYSNLGIVYAQQGDLENAIKNFQKAIELNPNDQNSKSNLERAQKLKLGN